MAGLISIVSLTQWRETPKPQVSRELAKPQRTLLAEEVITVTRRRTVKATRA